MNIVIVSSKGWFCREDAEKLKSKCKISFIKHKNDLSIHKLNKLKPDIIFFVHWNWMVSREIISKFRCILFHTAPLPYGRGGSPIQNLILRDFKTTPLWALEMTEELDAGPLLIKQIISLDGRLEEIFNRAKIAILTMIDKLISTNIKAKKQKGKTVNFRRLTRVDNEIPLNLSLKKFYDRIRMLDSDDYPDSYIYYGNKIINFKNVSKNKS